MDNKQERITDLMSVKFGVSKVSKTLKLKWDSTLYEMYAKTAKFIYDNGFANGDWQEQDYVDALKFTIENHIYHAHVIDIKPIVYNKINVDMLNVIKNKSGAKGFKVKDDNTIDVYLYQVKIAYDKDSIGFTAGYPTNYFVIIDPYNTTIKNIQEYYSWHPYTDETKKWGFNGVAVMNANYLIGKYKLASDFYKSFSTNLYSDKVNNGIVKFIKKLIDPSLRKKKYASYFKIDDAVIEAVEGKTKEYVGIESDNEYSIYNKNGEIYGFIPIKYKDRLYTENVAKKVLRDYILNTYNIILQQSYMTRQASERHAKFFETKKTITKKKKLAMIRYSNSWFEYFKEVEIDNDVDLTKLKKLAPELESVVKLLPSSKTGEKPILRFRKLQNHRFADMYVLGMFTFFNNTLAVDFRKFGNNVIALTSFVHEYGHFLDYNTLPNYALLSLKKEFQPILRIYQKSIRGFSELSSKEVEYLLTPTEIFARAFEYYVALYGYQGSLIKDIDTYTNPKNIYYAAFNSLESELFTYFDSIFGDLRKNIKIYNELKTKDNK